MAAGEALLLTKIQWPTPQIQGSDSGLPLPQITTPDAPSTKCWRFLEIGLVTRYC